MRSIPLLALALLLAVPAASPAAEAVAPESPVAPAAPPHRAWSLSVGTGGGSFFEFADGLAGIRPAGYDERMRDRLQLNVRADRELSGRLRAGVAYAYVGWTHVFSSGGIEAGTIGERAHVLLADVTLRWHRGARVETYSALAAGWGRWHADGTVAGVRHQDTQQGFSFQLRAFGVSVGTERLRAFADLGLGFEGLVVAGLSVRL